MFLSTLVKLWPFLDVECLTILSLRSLGYFLERILVSLYDATVSDVSPSSSLAARDILFFHDDEDVFKCCVSPVKCPLRRGVKRDGYIHNRGGGELLPYNRLMGMCC